MMLRVAMMGGLVATSTVAMAKPSQLFASCGDAGQQRMYSYDAGAVRRRGTLLLVPVTANYSRVPNSRAATAKLQWAVDCKAQTFTEESRVEYAANGRVIARYRATPSMGINRDSVADKLSQRICA